jgi:hypothetical protein
MLGVPDELDVDRWVVDHAPEVVASGEALGDRGGGGGAACSRKVEGQRW